MSDSKEEIPDDSGLLRRVHPDHIVDDTGGSVRVSSAAFKDPRMSVDVEPMLLAAGLDWNFSVQSYPEHFLVRVKAGVARENNQKVVYCPLEENPFHSEVRGKKTGSIANALRRAAEWVKKPDKAA